MKKAYYSFKASDFEKFDSVDKNGELKYSKMSDLGMSLPEDNILFFEGKKRTFLSCERYGSNVRELVSGERFKIKISKVKDSENYVISISSKNLGLRLKREIPFTSSIPGAKISGFLNYLKENSLLENYVNGIINYVEEANESNKAYYDIIDGPSKSLKKEISNLAKK